MPPTASNPKIINRYIESIAHGVRPHLIFFGSIPIFPSVPIRPSLCLLPFLCPSDFKPSVRLIYRSFMSISKAAVSDKSLYFVMCVRMYFLARLNALLSANGFVSSTIYILVNSRTFFWSILRDTGRPHIIAPRSPDSSSTHRRSLAPAGVLEVMPFRYPSI